MSKPINLRCGKQVLDLSRPLVMGILNITPDSFSDGGELLRSGRVELEQVLRRADAMVTAGAALLDIGGESTRPGAEPVSEAAELDRVVPVVEALASRFDVVLSVDTSTAQVISACAAVGAGLINDVRALTRPGALAAAIASGLPACLMHMQGEPGSMQNAPYYQDVVADVLAMLEDRVNACVAAGLERSRLLVDPGFGFGKTLEHNLALLGQLEALSTLHLPILVGFSRKRMLGMLVGRSERDRMAAGLAAAVAAVLKGARIVRTHDVAETVDAMKVCEQLVARD
jgi:dihydropteroate synthase